jgi:hypothetical protein
MNAEAPSVRDELQAFYITWSGEEIKRGAIVDFAREGARHKHSSALGAGFRKWRGMRGREGGRYKISRCLIVL